MMTQVMKVEIQASILAAMATEPRTIRQLKDLLRIHEVAITIMIRDLQNLEKIEHGYLSHDGLWLDDWFPDEYLPYEHYPIDAWRVCG